MLIPSKACQAIAKRLLPLVLVVGTGLPALSQCTTYGSGTPVDFSGTCTETVNRNHNGTGLLTISGDLTFSSGTFFVRGPVLVTGSLTLTGSAQLEILVNGNLQVGSTGSVSAQTVEVGADGALTIDAGGIMTATSFINDAFGPLTNDVTVNGTLTVSPGTFTNNGDGTIAGSGTINADINDTGTSTFTGTHNGSCTGNCDGVLPVELVSFEASGRQVCKLYWTTASEVNNQGFVIERRNLDQPAFERIGYVPGYGTTNEARHYSFIDHHVTSASYYRLRQIDFDGQFEFSPTIVFEPSENESNRVQLAKGLDGSIAFINWPFNVNRVLITSLSGHRAVASELQSGQYGQEFISSAMGSFPDGIYLISLFTSDEVQRIKWVHSGQ